MDDHGMPGEGGVPREARLTHRSGIVLAVAVATYFIGRMGAPLLLLTLFGLAVAAALYAHLAGRGDDRLAAFYAAVTGIGAALVAGLLDGWA